MQASGAAGLEPVIVVKGLTKKYPGVVALDSVSIQVGKGEVVGLVGENGAGKSTLLKVIAGVVQPESGCLEISGSGVVLSNAREAARVGIGLVSQDQSVLPNLTVAENIALGTEDIVTPGPFYSWKKVRRWAKRWLSMIAGRISPNHKGSELPFQDRQLVEMAKALSARQHGAGVGALLLDEPTTVLDAEQIEELFALIRKQKADTAIMFVSHRLEEVLRISDRVYVMRDGQVVGERQARECSEDELFRMMVGRPLPVTAGGASPRRASLPDRKGVRLEIVDLAGRGFSDVSFRVHEGEVVGIAGVQGSGKEALCRAVFGAEPVRSGEVRVDGRRAALQSPRSAVVEGIGYLPANRRLEGAAANLSLLSNMTLSTLPGFARFGVIDSKAERRRAEEWMSRLHIKAPSLAAPLGTLSGGNQQKALLARWLMGGFVRVMVLDHPTRGLDIAAKRDVCEIVSGLREEGIAVLLLADSLEELIELSDRIVVMKDGVVKKVLDVAGAWPTPVEIVAEMV